MTAIKRAFPLFLSALIILMAISWLIFWSQAQKQSPDKFYGTEDEVLHDFGPVAEFNLTERSNKPLGLADLKGKIWIADFIFTTCPGPCPILTQKMSQLQTAMQYADDVKLVSFSVDPERDTPEVLSQYADSYGAQPDKWYFLTGDKKEIYNFAIKSLKLSITEEDNQIIHSTMFVLVDKHGHIRGYYNTSKAEYMSMLANDVERLRQEGTESE